MWCCCTWRIASSKHSPTIYCPLASSRIQLNLILTCLCACGSGSSTATHDVRSGTVTSSCIDRGGGLGFWYSHEPLYPQLLSSGSQFCQPACQFCHQGCQLWPECPLPLPQPPLNPEYIAQDNSVTRQRRRSHAVCHGLWQKKVQCKKKVAKPNAIPIRTSGEIRAFAF